MKFRSSSQWINHIFSFKWFLFILCTFSLDVSAATFTVTNNADSGAGSLRNAIISANASPGSTININAGLNVTVNSGGGLPLITQSVNIVGLGAGATISGSNSSGLFFAYSGIINISNLTLNNGRSKGGNGGNGGLGGGGALGAGGAVFVNNLASVTLTDVVITNASAVGGKGGDSTAGNLITGGGGGMLQGDGGVAQDSGNSGAGGGGGIGGTGGIGGFPFIVNIPGGPGADGLFNTPGYKPPSGIRAGTGETAGNAGGLGGFQGGGGGGGGRTNGRAGGGGIGGLNATSGGTGGQFGGGGGGNVGSGGGGGGWGGGSGYFAFAGGYGGGGTFYSGNGGNGQGGAIFVRSGGTLIVRSTNVNTAITGGAVTGGAGGTGASFGSAGSALGEAIFMNGSSITFDIGAGRTHTINRSISADFGAGIIKTGSGTLTLVNNGAQQSNFTGGVNIQGGMVIFYNDTALGAAGSAVNISNGSILNFFNSGSLSNRAIILGSGGGQISTFGGVTATVPGIVSGNALTFNGPGILNLSNAGNTFNGLNIAGGTVNVSNNGQLGTAAGAVNFTNNAILNITSAITIPRLITLGAVGGTINTAGVVGTLSGSLTGGTNLTITGAGTTVFSGTTKANTGYVVISNGATLRTDSANVMTSTGAPTGDVNVVAGGIFNLNNNSQVIRNLTGGGAITSGSGRLTVTSSTPTIFSGVISGSNGFTKSGSSKLTLSGNSSYTSGTTISNGTLAIQNDIVGARNLGATGFNINMSGASTLSFEPVGAAMSLDVGRTVALSGTSGIFSTQDGKTITINSKITGAGTGGFTYFGGGATGIFIPTNVANDYSNGTNLQNAVTVQITQESQLGAVGPINISGSSTLAVQPAGATLSLNSSRTINLSGLGGIVSTTNGKTITLPQKITGPAAFTYQGNGVATGTFVPSNNSNDYTLGTTIRNAATVQITQESQLGAVATLTLNGGTLAVQPAAATLSFNANRVISLAGTGGSVSTLNGKFITLPQRIIGSGGMRYIGGGASGVFIPSNSSGVNPNNYTGGTTISGAATVVVALDRQLGDPNAVNGITFNNGNLIMTASFNSARNITMTGAGSIDVNAFNPSFSGQFLAGAGILTKLGTGELKLTFNGVNLNTGGFIVSAGTLTGNTSTLKGPIVNNSHLIIDQSINAIPINTGIYTSAISGTGDLLVKAAGSSATVSGANTFIGGTVVQSGTLYAGAVNTLPPRVNGNAVAGSINLQGTSILDLAPQAPNPNPGNYNQNIGDLTGAVGTIVKLGTATFKVGSQVGAAANSGVSTTMQGIIQSATGGIFHKQGNSKLTLTNLNNYLGETRVLGGTLTVSLPNGRIPAGVTQIAAGATLEINGGTVVGGITGGTGLGVLSTGTLLITSNFTPTNAVQFVDTITVGPAGNVTYNLTSPTFNNLNVDGNGSNALLTVNNGLAVGVAKTLTVQGLVSAGSTGTVNLVLGGLTNNGGIVNVLPNGFITSTNNPQQSFINSGTLNLAGGLITCPIIGGGNSTINVTADTSTGSDLTNMPPDNFKIHVFSPAVFTINHTVSEFRDPVLANSFIIDAGASTVVTTTGLVQTPSNLATPITNNGNVTLAGGIVMNPIVGSGVGGASSLTVIADSTTYNTITNVKTINVNSGTFTVAHAITGFVDFNINSGPSGFGIVNLNVPLDMTLAPNANLNVYGNLNTLGNAITGDVTSTFHLYADFKSTDPINGFGTFVVHPGGNFNMAVAPSSFNQFTIGAIGQSTGTLLLNADLNMQGGSVMDIYGVLNMNNKTINGVASSIININNGLSTNGQIQGVGIINATAGSFTVNNAPTNFVQINLSGTNTTLLNVNLPIPNASILAVGSTLNMGHKNITLGELSQLNITGGLSTNGLIQSTVGAADGYLINVQNGGQFTVNTAVTGYNLLTVGAGGTLTLKPAGNLANFAAAAPTVTMNGGTFYLKKGGVFAGDINGPGTLNIGSFAAATTVTQAGIINVTNLNVNSHATLDIPLGVTATNLSVNSGGTLLLHNDITGTLVNNSGGTITHDANVNRTITGDFVHAGLLNVTMTDAITLSHITVTGTTTLMNGNRIHIELPTGEETFETGDTFTILTSAGGFAPGSTLPILSYPPSVLLSFKPVMNGNNLLLEAHIKTFEELNNIPALEPLSIKLDELRHSLSADDFSKIFGALDIQESLEGFENTLSQFAPGGLNGETIVPTTIAMNLALERIERQLVLARSGFDTSKTGYSAGDMAEGHSSYGPMVFGNSARQRNRAGLSGFTATTGGFGFLWDTPLSQFFRMGFSISYAGSFVRKDDSSRSTTTIASVQESLYGSANYGPLFMDALLGLGQNRYHGKKNQPSIGVTSIADYKGKQYTGKVKGGFTVPFYDVELAPMASVQYMRLSQDAYIEKGPGPNQSVDPREVSGMQLGLGARIADVSHAEDFLPEIHAMYIHDIKLPEVIVTSRFVDGGGSFISKGPLPPKSGINLGGSITAAMLNGNFLITGSYDLEAKKTFINHAASLKFRYLF